MNRPTFVYLLVCLTMVLLVFSSLPLAAASPSNAPAGVTETPTPAPTATNTPAPTATNTSAPTATNTPAPTATNTSVPAPANTTVPAPASTVVPAPTNTLTAPTPVGLPFTGGAAPQGGAVPWILALAAAVVGSLGALAFGLSMRAHRSTRR